MSSKLSTAVSDALSNVVTNHPFFAVYLMDQLTLKESREFPTAATDGQTIYVNPDFFERMTIKERVFVLAHEIMHGIMQHMYRGELYRGRGIGPDFKPWNSKNFNVAADYVINDMLIKSKIGKMPSEGLRDSRFDHTMLVDDVYQQINKEDEQQKQHGDQGQGQEGDGDTSGDGHGGFDQHIKPDPTKPQPSEAETKRAIQSAINAAKAVGKLPGALERLVGELLDPAVLWKDELRRAMTMTAGSDSQTWARPNRRRLAVFDTYLPSTVGHQTGGVAVVIDTSGSISASMVTRFLSEVASILEDCKPAWCRVLWTDSMVQHVDEVEDAADLRGLKAHGGGGTDMGAALAYIEDEGMEPETIVVLTDGYTPWGYEPPCQIIWGITEKSNTAPYGRTIHIDEK